MAKAKKEQEKEVEEVDYYDGTWYVPAGGNSFVKKPGKTQESPQKKPDNLDGGV